MKFFVSFLSIFSGALIIGLPFFFIITAIMPMVAVIMKLSVHNTMEVYLPVGYVILVFFISIFLSLKKEK